MEVYNLGTRSVGYSAVDSAFLTLFVLKLLRKCVKTMQRTVEVSVVKTSPRKIDCIEGFKSFTVGPLLPNFVLILAQTQLFCMKVQSVFALLAFSLLLAVVCSLSTKKLHVSYPAELLLPVTGSIFLGNVTQDKLLCFGNRDYSTPTYIETLYCMLPYFPGTYKYCTSVWGSRSVEVEAIGSVEFLRVNKLPHETSSTILHGDHLDSTYALELSVTRWLEMNSNSQPGMTYVKKNLQIPAEPLYLCARSTNWQGEPSSFQMKFRPARLRGRDKRHSNDQTLVHIMLIMAVSSAWLIPYLTALLAAVLAYEHAIKVMLTLFMISTSVVCLTPLMLTKHNRSSAKQYFNYYFTRMQAQETRTQIKKRLPVFQALFFSSVVIFFGFGAIYVAYYYDFLERETRNMCFKGTLALAISWFTFSFCRSFERFFRDWLWIAVSVSLAHILDKYLNPMCRNEVVVATMVISQVIRLLIPHIVKFEFINKLVSSALPRLQNFSTKLRIPLPYQIYEHDSLRHLLEAEHNIAQGSPFHAVDAAINTAASVENLMNLRRSVSSRASLAQINLTQQVQPLVDYIDEVMEGSICPDENEDDVDDFQINGDNDSVDQNNAEDDSLQGEDSDVLSIGSDGDEGEGDGEGQEEVEVVLEEIPHQTEPNSVVQSGTSSAVLAESSSATSSSGAAAGAVDSLVSKACRSDAPAIASMSQCLVPGASASSTQPPLLSALQTTIVAVQSAHTTEHRNRAALIQHEGLDLVDIPNYTQTSTAAPTPVQASAAADVAIRAPSVQQPTPDDDKAPQRKSSRKASTKKTDGFAVAPGVGPVTTGTASSSAVVDITPVASADQVQQVGRLVGAVVTPLHLVGPLTLQLVDNEATNNISTGNESSAGEKAAAESAPVAATGSSKSKKAGKGKKADITAAAESTTVLVAREYPSTRVWLPLATHDVQLVHGLQGVCDALHQPATYNISAPVQDMIVFSATLHFAATHIASSKEVHRCVEDLDRNKAALHSLCSNAGPETSVFLLATVKPVDLNLKCVIQGSTTVLQLSLPTTSTVCSVIALVDTGKAALRRILIDIKRAHPCVVQHKDIVLVNHLRLTSLERVTPCAHHVNVQCTLHMPSSAQALSLINMHQQCDRYEANAHIVRTLASVLLAIGGDARCAEAAAFLDLDLQMDASDTNCVVVTGCVPVLLAQCECARTIDNDNHRSNAAKKCLSMLSAGAVGNADSVHGSVGGMATCALLAYISFLQRSR